jgi:hypothetical protein
MWKCWTRNFSKKFLIVSTSTRKAAVSDVASLFLHGENGENGKQKTYSPGLQLPQFSGIPAINYKFLGGFDVVFYAGLLTLEDIMAGARTDAEFQSRLRVMGSVVLRCTGRDLWVFRPCHPEFFGWKSHCLSNCPKDLGSTIHLCFYECI